MFFSHCSCVFEMHLIAKKRKKETLNIACKGLTTTEGYSDEYDFER